MSPPPLHVASTTGLFTQPPPATSAGLVETVHDRLGKVEAAIGVPLAVGESFVIVLTSTLHPSKHLLKGERGAAE